MGENGHGDKVTEYFGRYHEAYAKSEGHARGGDLAALIGALNMQARPRVLDAACGTGHTAVAMAQRGWDVVGLDMTQQMLDEAQGLARSRGVRVQWTLGDVHAMPWSDQSFNAVTCRRAAHHFRELDRFLDEVYRVLMPGGQIGISDMTAPSDAIAALNQLERVRDSSHWAARTANEWANLVASHGFDLQILNVAVEPMTCNQWLSPVSATSAHGHQALTLLDSGNVPQSLSQEGMFFKHRMILVAEKTARRHRL